MSATNRDVQSTDQWLDQTLDQVFLSPRVIDERAYEELSGSLRTLMKDAAGQSRALIATTGEVKLLGDQLREATQQLQAKVETAVRVIPTLDQRMKQAEALLEVTGKDLETKVAAMQDAATRAVPIERERIAAQLHAEAATIVDSLVAEQVARLRATLLAEVDSVETALTPRLRQLTEPLERARESLESSITAFEGRAAALREQLQRDETRLADLAASIDGRLARAEETSRAIETIAARVSECAARAESAQSSIESTVTEAGVRLGAGVSQAEKRAQDLTARLSTELEAVNAALGALHAEVEAANGPTPAARQPAPNASPLPDPRQLEELGEWLQQLIAQGDRIGRGLAALIQRSQAGANRPGER